MLLCYLDQRPSLWDLAQRDNRLNIFVLALQGIGYEESNRPPNMDTVFAPSDAAFAQLPADTAERLSDPQNVEELARLLSYHVISNRILTSNDLSTMRLPARIQTLEGDFITVTRQNNRIKINNATIIAADIRGSDGILHIIDTVLIPPSSSS